VAKTLKRLEEKINGRVSLLARFLYLVVCDVLDSIYEDCSHVMVYRC
jgi:hypothetical protein